MNGQAIKQDFYILNTSAGSENLDLIPKKIECCFTLPALAEPSFTDKHKNDKHSVIWFFGELFSDAKIYIQKKVNGIYEDQELDDDTYGEFKAFGFYVNKFNEKAIGYQIDWAKVLVNSEGGFQGEGVYRFKGEGTPAIGDPVVFYSFEFHLQKYADHRADGTVRAEWYRKGILGSKENDAKIDDFGNLNYYNSIRLPKSIFGLETSSFERTYIKPPNGSQIWTKDDQIEEMIWRIRQMPEPVHRFLRIDMMQSGRVIINDYNSDNPTKHIDREVVPNSNYAPVWTRGAMTAPVELKFNPYYQNLTHLRE